MKEGLRRFPTRSGTLSHESESKVVSKRSSLVGTHTISFPGHLRTVHFLREWTSYSQRCTKIRITFIAMRVMDGRGREQLARGSYLRGIRRSRIVFHGLLSESRVGHTVEFPD